MYTLLSWQLKKRQSGTSKHEVREKACHVALSALPRVWAGGDPHELGLLARRSRPGVRSTRPGPSSDNLRRNPDMFSMAVTAMRKRKIVVAAALAVALLSPAAAAATVAAPAAQASVSHSAAASSYGGSWAGNAALNWAEGNA